MKKRSNCRLFLGWGLILLALIAIVQATAAGNWDLIPTTGVPGFGFTTVGFFDKTHGIAIGLHGENVYTVDNGNNWNELTIPEGTHGKH